jgi:hypothetical protein
VSDEWSLAYGGVITLVCVAVLVAIHLTPRRAPRHSPPPSRTEGLRTL